MQVNSLNEEICWLIEGILEGGNLSRSYLCGPYADFSADPYSAVRYKDQDTAMRERLRALHLQGIPCVPVQHAFERNP